MRKSTLTHAHSRCPSWHKLLPFFRLKCTCSSSSSSFSSFPFPFLSSLLTVQFSFDQLLSFYLNTGILLSFFIFSGLSFSLSPLLTPFLFLLLFLSYLAVKCVGREWTALQFDSFILEGGFSCVFVSLALAFVPTPSSLSPSLSSSLSSSLCGSESVGFLSFSPHICQFTAHFALATLTLSLWPAWWLIFRVMFSR